MKTKENITRIFGDTDIRTNLDSEKKDYWFSVVDTIKALKYWNDLKIKIHNEGSELYENIVQLKIKTKI